jgi:hypothetical protein
MFTHRSAWRAISIDPRLRDKWHGMRRIQLYQDTVEDVLDIFMSTCSAPPERSSFDRVLVVAVHSHAPLDKALHLARLYCPKRLAVIAIPCCVQQKLHVPPDIRYIDRNIWSPENEVLIWRNLTYSNDTQTQGHES